MNIMKKGCIVMDEKSVPLQATIRNIVTTC